MKIGSLAFALALGTLSPQAAMAACGEISEAAMQTPSTPPETIATAEHPAIYQLPDSAGNLAGAAALELTVRPTEMTEGDSFFVQVFAGKDDPSLLGTFSLFGARKGETQIFIVEPPEPDTTGPIELTMKLLPAHPAGDLGASALELVDARIVR